VVVLTILKNMSSSMGRIIPYMTWKIKHVPNHQPDNSWTIVGLIMGIMVIMVNYYIFIYIDVPNHQPAMLCLQKIFELV